MHHPQVGFIIFGDAGGGQHMSTVPQELELAKRDELHPELVALGGWILRHKIIRFLPHLWQQRVAKRTWLLHHEKEKKEKDGETTKSKQGKEQGQGRRKC